MTSLKSTLDRLKAMREKIAPVEVDCYASAESPIIGIAYYDEYSEQHVTIAEVSRHEAQTALFVKEAVNILPRLIAALEKADEALEFYAKNRGLHIDHNKNAFGSSDCGDGVDFHGAKARETRSAIAKIVSGES